MKKVVIAAIGIVLLGAGYYFISPFFINKTVNETLPIVENTEDTSVEVIKQGQFEGFDKIHTGSGTASVISIGDKNYIRFEEDFVVN
jgi:hypothetical protein